MVMKCQHNKHVSASVFGFDNNYYFFPGIWGGFTALRNGVIVDLDWNI